MVKVRYDSATFIHSNGRNTGGCYAKPGSRDVLALLTARLEAAE